MKFIQSAVLFVVIAQSCAGKWSICELSICVVQGRMSRYHGSCMPWASVNPISTPNYNANIRKMDEILTELGRINYISARNIISPNMVHFILSNKPHRNIVLVSNIRFYFILFVICNNWIIHFISRKDDSGDADWEFQKPDEQPAFQQIDTKYQNILILFLINQQMV